MALSVDKATRKRSFDEIDEKSVNGIHMLSHKVLIDDLCCISVEFSYPSLFLSSPLSLSPFSPSLELSCVIN